MRISFESEAIIMKLWWDRGRSNRYFWWNTIILFCRCGSNWTAR